MHPRTRVGGGAHSGDVVRRSVAKWEGSERSEA